MFHACFHSITEAQFITNVPPEIMMFIGVRLPFTQMEVMLEENGEIAALDALDSQKVPTYNSQLIVK